MDIGLRSFITLSDHSGAQPDTDDRYIEPYATDKDANGERYNTILAGVINPMIQAQRDDFNQRMNLNGNLFAEVDIPFIDGLSNRINFGNNYRRVRDYEFRSYGNDFQGAGEKMISFRHDLILDNIVSYKKEINDNHKIDVTLLYGFEKNQQETTTAGGQNYVNDVLGYNRLQAGAADNQQAISGAWDQLNLYSMARVFYGLNDKYLFTGTVRRDGFSGFGKENKIGVFPSFSVAWRAGDEPFINQNLDWLSDLKIRTSYGTVGNRTIGRYETLSRVTGGFGFINMAHSPQYTQNVTSLQSPSLKWEKTTGLDVGIDFGLFSNRIYGTIDYYNNNTTDLFYRVDIPAISRYEQFPDNLGKLHNRGIELSLTSVNVARPDFEWSSSINFYRNRNELKELLGLDLNGDGQEDNLVSEGLFIGESIDAIYDYELDGKWQLDEEIPSGYDLGAHKPVDQNGDGTIDPADDRKIVGNRNPSYSFGINNSFSYKNWNLEFFIHSIQGGQNYYLAEDNLRDFSIENSEMHYRYILPAGIDFWTPENPNARYQRPNINTASGIAGNLYGDRSFIRLKDVSLSYNLPRNFLQTTGLQNARVYLSGKNLLTFTKWNGWDPETGETITRDGRPVLRNYTIGLNIGF